MTKLQLATRCSYVSVCLGGSQLYLKIDSILVCEDVLSLQAKWAGREGEHHDLVAVDLALDQLANFLTLVC